MHVLIINILMKKVKYGIALYNIELSGCLNGVYTNENEKGIISNSISIKKSKSDSLIGEYDYSYFENGVDKKKGNDNYKGELVISYDPSFPKVYKFDWNIDTGFKKISFEGKGYKMNEKQIAVRYQSV